MRFVLASLVGSIRSQYPAGLEAAIKLACTHQGCRSGKTSLSQGFKDSATGKQFPLVVHVEGIDGPVCYSCYRSYYGGGVEDYASFLVREHGFDRCLVPTFDAPTAVDLIGRPSQAAERREDRPPAADEPRRNAGSRPLPERRAFGQAPGAATTAERPRPPVPAVRPRPPAPPPRERVPAPQVRPPAPAPRPKSPAPPPREREPVAKPPEAVKTVERVRPPAPPVAPKLPPRREFATAAPASDARPPSPPATRGRDTGRRDTPRWTPPPKAAKSQGSAAVTLGDLAGGLKGFKAEFKSAEEAEAAAQAKWLAAFGGAYRVSGKAPGEGHLVIVEGRPEFYPGGITGIGPDGVSFGGADEGATSPVVRSHEVSQVLRTAGWRYRRAVVTTGEKPVVVAHCDKNGVVEETVQSDVAATWFQSPEIPGSTRLFVPTHEAAVSNPPASVPCLRIRHRDGDEERGILSLEGLLFDRLAELEEKHSPEEAALKQVIRKLIAGGVDRGLIALARLWNAAIDTYVANAPAPQPAPSESGERPPAGEVSETDPVEAAPSSGA